MHLQLAEYHLIAHKCQREEIIKAGLFLFFILINSVFEARFMRQTVSQQERELAEEAASIWWNKEAR